MSYRMIPVFTACEKHLNMITELVVRGLKILCMVSEHYRYVQNQQHSHQNKMLAFYISANHKYNTSACLKGISALVK